jgi:hypothetical protein
MRTFYGKSFGKREQLRVQMSINLGEINDLEERLPKKIPSSKETSKKSKSPFLLVINRASSAPVGRREAGLCFKAGSGEKNPLPR